MSQEEIQAKIKLYQDAFEILYKQACADIQKAAGTQGQAAQAATEDLHNIVHRVLFGHGHDEEGKEIP